VEIKRLKEAEAAAKAKEKAQFGGLFNKVSMYNDKDDNVVVPSGSNPKVRGSGHVPGGLSSRARLSNKPRGSSRLGTWSVSEFLKVLRFGPLFSSSVFTFSSQPLTFPSLSPSLYPSPSSPPLLNLLPSPPGRPPALAATPGVYGPDSKRRAERPGGV
jgi:hypothetical protein